MSVSAPVPAGGQQPGGAAQEDAREESGTQLPPSVDLGLTVAHPARMYDWYLGGKTNFGPDRRAARKVLQAVPQIGTVARENRRFMHRAVRYLAERGVRQFLDIGTGIPTPPNLHEVAQSVAPSSRVVYVDNDPVVLVHARALLESGPQGRTGYVQADLLTPGALLRAVMQPHSPLDWKQPIALSLCAILHFVPDGQQPRRILHTLVGALPPGSYLVVSHVTGDFAPDALRAAVKVYRDAGIPAQVRSRPEIEALLPPDLMLVQPGVELVSRWHPGLALEPAGPPPPPEAVSCYGLVARKAP